MLWRRRGGAARSLEVVVGMPVLLLVSAQGVRGGLVSHGGGGEGRRCSPKQQEVERRPRLWWHGGCLGAFAVVQARCSCGHVAEASRQEWGLPQDMALHTHYDYQDRRYDAYRKKRRYRWYDSIYHAHYDTHYKRIRSLGRPTFYLPTIASPARSRLMHASNGQILLS